MSPTPALLASAVKPPLPETHFDAAAVKANVRATWETSPDLYQIALEGRPQEDPARGFTSITALREAVAGNEPPKKNNSASLVSKVAKPALWAVASGALLAGAVVASPVVSGVLLGSGVLAFGATLFLKPNKTQSTRPENAVAIPVDKTYPNMTVSQWKELYDTGSPSQRSYALEGLYQSDCVMNEKINIFIEVIRSEAEGAVLSRAAQLMAPHLNLQDIERLVTLYKQYNTGDNYYDQKAMKHRYYIVKALAGSQETTALLLLGKTLESDYADYVKTAAAESLAGTTNQLALRILIKQATCGNTSVEVACVKSLLSSVNKLASSQTAASQALLLELKNTAPGAISRVAAEALE